MSASANVARRAVIANPFLGNARALSTLGVSPAVLGRNARHLPRRTNALAILVPLRQLGTDHHNHGQHSGPPPGFNVEEAKKPLPKETATAAKTESKATKESNDASQSEKSASGDKALADKADSDASLTELAAAKNAAVETKKDGKKDEKLTVWQKVKKEAHHYWDGTKLLAAEVRISTRLALKMAAGYELSRRENRQLRRTVQDLGRLVPFSMFVIVPFAELLLPVALRLFPNMLPSTYEGQKSRDAKANTLRATRKEVSEFLRSSLKETGLPLTPATTQSEAFTVFFRKLRSSGESPTHEDVIKVCKIFKDDLTLDNLSRPQLVSMCRYMNLNTFGTDNMLRYQVRHRMRQIKRDDRQISYEGVDSLTVAELQVACASRGIRTHSVSPARMREYLQQWLDLRLKDGVPSTLLVLSNAYMYGQVPAHSQIEALVGVLSSIPDELFHEISLEVHTAEGAATNKQRLEVLKEQQELIDEENSQNEENASTGFATPRDVDNIDEKEDNQSAEAQAAPKSQAQEAKEAEQEMLAARDQTAQTEKKAEKSDQ
ncbi:LETM1 domain-containing protein mdm28 [Colletotrichum siamense]|uniref:LETM1 domain-containing protein mdm28 n=1 Tax=Colletotrichum siamense TaxID=690259 RepID=A0A9P5EIP8_COLSI|nr:LETM1 domain-containing protein mdm28 [Colletotrichum siamense]KAI8178294.1 LETM1 domain-containing protein mdm28 [Colletotrichum sp. SAR 10_75]KAI8199020.1 LETM1 domain-containing protein mdm28 [Colletotrichum sp. SAR 10_76]KAI8223010.1 LETM1 domain-containing protein mdm28 [Colletotrichum sp. SAR 10_96]KAI8253847.1 LETM1 domain-containing protein mdm28 [Colletotrichum sp. SAR 10_77]KAJ4995799.1 LETM1 domain-containing protein mdm28 [Colletotrichum sp. SAR 10_66]KAJ5007726.1 LETM1 domain-